MIAALRNRRFLVFGGAALLCIMFLTAAVMVHARQSYSLYAQRNEAAKELSDLRAAIEGVDFDKLQEENEGLVAELGEIERALPEAEYVPTLIRQIESSAALTGNDLTELRQGEVRKGKVALGGAAAEAGKAEGGNGAGGKGKADKDEAPETGQGQRYDEMDVELRFDGSYRGAFDFLRELGNLGKIIAVESVEIEKAGAGEVRPDGRAAATVRLQAKAYILAPHSGFPGELSIKVY
jgi:Tfp pilus assembly protein PilO